MAMSLRHKHLDVIKRMLNLNQPLPAGGTGDDAVYKVLVVDKFCRDILSPLIHLHELRKHGVTICFMIDVERQNIPDAPAIYFVQPTAPNIHRIIQDAARGVYESFHLNFSSSLPRALLEELAMGALKNDCMHRLSKVFDQYAEFVTLDTAMFSLALPDTYVRLNDPCAQDKDIEAAVDAIVNGLFSVFVTLGVVPVLRCARGGPAEMVATQLDARIRDHLVSRNNLFTEPGHFGTSFQRPLCCIFDRNFELSVGVQHVWTYRPLVHDVLGMKLNRVVVQGEGAAAGVAGKGAAKSFELDESDTFWVANNAAAFPKVAEEVEAQLKKYKEDVEEVNRRTGGRADVPFDEQELLGNTKHLMSAVNSLPELTERKKMIDKHTNIATALLGEIKSRNLDGFYSLEEDMLTKGTVDKTALLGALKGKGTSDDKLRLGLVYLLAMESAAGAEIESVEAALREARVDVTSFLYVKRIRSLNISLASVNTGSKSNLVDWLSTTVTAGVKNFLSAGRQLALTRTVESLMEARLAPELESYMTLDPRAPKGSAPGIHTKGPFKEAVVFMIGGGNYLEHGSLVELGQRCQPGKNIIYGCTEVVTGAELSRQLGVLGHKMGVDASA
ncbi:SEC1 family transport protein SLY1 [Selaginella moellendorffii]|nr:SEC1 family transport protein SLY1 [Selaginella moellendorffii]|eukprot:XP_002972416.2 SEC1 family transport protein SLY1 [Selaginella moellendorffii]